MAASTNLPDLRTEYPPHPPGRDPAEPSTLLGLLPGIALLFVVGYAGKFTEQSIAAYGRAHQLTAAGDLPYEFASRMIAVRDQAVSMLRGEKRICAGRLSLDASGSCGPRAGRLPAP